MKISTFENVKDLAVSITNKLVEADLIPDCTDTEDETEYKFQDELVSILCKQFNIENIGE